MVPLILKPLGSLLSRGSHIPSLTRSPLSGSQGSSLLTPQRSHPFLPLTARALTGSPHAAASQNGGAGSEPAGRRKDTGAKRNTKESFEAPSKMGLVPLPPRRSGNRGECGNFSFFLPPFSPPWGRREGLAGSAFPGGRIS